MLQTLNPLTGTSLAPTVALPHGASSVTATAGGVWVVSAGLLENVPYYLYWVPSGARSATLRATHPDRIAVTLQNHTVWITGSQQVFCADPATGRTRTSLTLPDESYFSGTGLHSIGAQLYGTYFRGAPYQEQTIVRVDPPKTCHG